ncbi:MAG TPA: DNA-directed RNA polymerase subunit omega [Bacteroidales bacterium]|nr:DNA-directed RNA polymerase subunit omega [Bacteroidales bacterium]HPT51849.1 DNA-directed RNA polymerase subunit omega [Bacteroidales bacterium]
MKTDFKKSNAETMAITRNIREYDKETDNIYESVVIMSKRANQIALEIKDEMNQEMQEFAPAQDTLDEVFENRDLIDLAKSYEKLPKPTLLAVKEFEDKKIYSKRNEDDDIKNV